MYFWNPMSTKKFIPYAVLIVMCLSTVCLCAYAPFWVPDVLTSRQLIAQNMNASCNMLSKFQTNNLGTSKSLKSKSDLIGALLEHRRFIRLDVDSLRLRVLDGTVNNGKRCNGKMEWISNISETFHIINDYYLWRPVFGNFKYVTRTEQVLNYFNWLNTYQPANAFGDISELAFTVNDLHCHTHFLFEEYRTPTKPMQFNGLFDCPLNLNETAVLKEIVSNNHTCNASMLNIFKR